MKSGIFDDVYTLCSQKHFQIIFLASVETQTSYIQNIKHNQTRFTIFYRIYRKYMSLYGNTGGFDLSLSLEQKGKVNLLISKLFLFIKGLFKTTRLRALNRNSIVKTFLCCWIKFLKFTEKKSFYSIDNAIFMLCKKLKINVAGYNVLPARITLIKIQTHCLTFLTKWNYSYLERKVRDFNPQCLLIIFFKCQCSESFHIEI